MDARPVLTISSTPPPVSAPLIVYALIEPSVFESFTSTGTPFTIEYNSILALAADS